MDNNSLETIARDLDSIKKLMILGLIQRGFKQKQVASLLGISDATLSTMFPKGLLKDARHGTAADE